MKTGCGSWKSAANAASGSGAGAGSALGAGCDGSGSSGFRNAGSGKVLAGLPKLKTGCGSSEPGAIARPRRAALPPAGALAATPPLLGRCMTPSSAPMGADRARGTQVARGGPKAI